jgi:serine protease Do
MRAVISKHRYAALALILGLVIGLGAGTLGTSRADAPPTPAAVIASGSFAKLAEAVKPAVINVTVQGRDIGGQDSPFSDEGPHGPFGGMPDQTPRRGLGSGVIIDPSGVAVTNAHVVDKASRIDVVTLDGARHTAKVLGVDTKTDLAVLQLDGGSSHFPSLPLGNSEETQVGDWVVAVGSPFGLQATVTSGIVSAKARQIGAGPYDEFLQTDAAINPGNSGGPLVNMRGEVVGINTAIVRGGSGIGFAIPSNLVKRITAELRTTGTVNRGWLGVSIQPLTPELATSFGLKGKKGALVSDVVAESPAAKAGLKPGDVVTRFNDEKVDGPSDLGRAVALAKPGQAGKLTVWREGAERTVDVTLGRMPSAAGESGSAEPSQHRLGLEVRPVTPEIARELDLRNTDGVVVARVEANSPAAEAGIQRGDVIREVGGQPVKNLGDFERLVRDGKKGAPLAMRLQRGPGSLYVAIAPERG